MAKNDDILEGTTKKPQMLAHYFSLANRINRASSFLFCWIQIVRSLALGLVTNRTMTLLWNSLKNFYPSLNLSYKTNQSCYNVLFFFVTKSRPLCALLWSAFNSSFFTPEISVISGGYITSAHPPLTRRQKINDRCRLFGPETIHHEDDCGLFQTI